MIFKLRLQFFHLKCCFGRITWATANRVGAFSRQIAAIARRRNLLLASLAGFSFRTIGISDEELTEIERSSGDPFKQPDPTEGWEKIYSDDRIAVFRRTLNGKGISEYRCIGTYPDISLEDFIRAQYDVEYRQKWDENVKSLEVLEEESASGSQVIRWETKYPYMMAPRLYIYVLRKSIDEAAKSVVVVSRAMDESSYPDPTAKNSNVRVTEYSSKLLVRAHTEMDKNGLDFVLVYHDDPKISIPKKVYDYGVNFVGPKYLSDVHTAARKLAEERQKTKASEEGEKPAAEGEAVQAVPASTTEETEAAKPEAKEAPKEEAKAAVEEEEELPDDPVARARQECAREEEPRRLKAILEQCNERVRTGGSEESCHMEMTDWVHALDHCAMPRAFRQLK